MPAKRNTPKEHKPGQWKNKGVAPSSEICARARKLGLLGITNEQLWFQLGIGKRLFERWMREYPTFKNAVMKGKIEADADMAESLYDQGMGTAITKTKVFYDPEAGIIEHQYEERQQRSTTATIFWLKNRHRQLWRDMSDKNVTMDGPIRLDSPTIIDITDYSEEERAELDRLIEADDGGTDDGDE